MRHEEAARAMLGGGRGLRREREGASERVPIGVAVRPSSPRALHRHREAQRSSGRRRMSAEGVTDDLVDRALAAGNWEVLLAALDELEIQVRGAAGFRGGAAADPAPGRARTASERGGGDG